MRLPVRLAILSYAMTLTSCVEDVILAPWGKENTFHIAKGAHYSTPRRPALPFAVNEGLHFSAILEPDTVYDVGPENQVNKLMGFSDCNDLHTDNSARLGWIYINGQMRVLPFVHYNGKMVYDVAKPLAVVTLGKEYRYKIEINGAEYIFSVQESDGQWTSQTLDRACDDDRRTHYADQPYFGGKHKAPHDMTVRINLE